MRKLILICSLLIIASITVMFVNATVPENYIAPIPIFYHRTHPSWFTYRVNITLVKTLPYYYYGFTDFSYIVEGNISIFKTKDYYTNLDDAISVIQPYYTISWYNIWNLENILDSSWESYKNITTTNNAYNFEFEVLQNDNATYLYQCYIKTYLDINEEELPEIEFMILKWIPTNTVPDYIISLEVGEINLPLIFILVFIPALIISAIFSKYNLGLEGLTSGITITSCISYQIMLIPLWFIIMIVIIDVTLILTILHQRGVF